MLAFRRQCDRVGILSVERQESLQVAPGVTARKCLHHRQHRTRAHVEFLTAYLYVGLGSSLLLLHDLDGAEAALEAALERFAELEFRFGSLDALNCLGFVALEKDECRRARELFAQAVEQSVAIGFRSALLDSVACLAGLAVRQGDLPHAARLYGAAQALSARFGAASYEPALTIASQRYQALLRGTLAPDALEGAWQEGRQMSLEEALALGLASDAGATRPMSRPPTRWPTASP